MSHTPEQARALWCPMSRVAQSGNVDVSTAYNRTLTKQTVPVKVSVTSEDGSTEPRHELMLHMTPAVSMAANCLADKCAMWRWVPGGQKNSAGDRHPTTRGYCGLAGRPEVAP